MRKDKLTINMTGKVITEPYMNKNGSLVFTVECRPTKGNPLYIEILAIKHAARKLIWHGCNVSIHDGIGFISNAKQQTDQYHFSVKVEDDLDLNVISIESNERKDKLSINLTGKVTTVPYRNDNGSLVFLIESRPTKGNPLFIEMLAIKTASQKEVWLNSNVSVHDGIGFISKIKKPGTMYHFSVKTERANELFTISVDEGKIKPEELIK